MAKEKDLTELVWAEKDGYERRQFTRQQLNAMGSDPSGNTFDGWKITQEAKEPKEVTAARSTRKPKEEATQNDTDNGQKTVATETSTDAGSKDSNE